MIPVDWRVRQGQANLAVIRIPAERHPDRIAVRQSGRAGRLGGGRRRRDGRRTDRQPHQRAFRPGRLRPARRRPLHAGVAVPHRRRVRRLAARADGRLQPGRRRAHRGAVPAVRRPLRAAHGHGLPGHRRNRVGRPRHGRRAAARSATTRSTIWASPTAPRSAPPTSSSSATTCARWCSTARSTPASDPVEKNVRQMAGFQTAFNDYAADCAQFADCPLGQDPGAVGRPLPPAGRPAGDQARPHLRSARPELRRRDHRHRQRAVHPDVLEVPDQRPARVAARRRRRRPAGAGRRIPGPRRRRALPQSAGCVQRGALRRRPGTDRPGGVGRRRPAHPAGRAVPVLRRVHRVRAAGHLRVLAGARHVVPARGDAGGARPGRRRLDHPRPGHAVSGGRGSGPPARRVADHVRGHPAHRGVQRPSSASTRRW